MCLELAIYEADCYFSPFPANPGRYRHIVSTRMVSQFKAFAAQINAAGTKILHALGSVSEGIVPLVTDGKNGERRISRNTLVNAHYLGEL